MEGGGDKRLTFHLETLALRPFHHALLGERQQPLQQVQTFGGGEQPFVGLGGEKFIVLHHFHHSLQILFLSLQVSSGLKALSVHVGGDDLHSLAGFAQRRHLAKRSGEQHAANLFLHGLHLQNDFGMCATLLGCLTVFQQTAHDGHVLAQILQQVRQFGLCFKRKKGFGQSMKNGTLHFSHLDDSDFLCIDALHH